MRRIDSFYHIFFLLSLHTDRQLGIFRKLSIIDHSPTITKGKLLTEIYQRKRDTNELILILQNKTVIKPIKLNRIQLI